MQYILYITCYLKNSTGNANANEIIFIGIKYYEFILNNAYIQIFNEHRITFITLLSVLLV